MFSTGLLWRREYEEEPPRCSLSLAGVDRFGDFGAACSAPHYSWAACRASWTGAALRQDWVKISRVDPLIYTLVGMGRGVPPPSRCPPDLTMIMIGSRQTAIHGDIGVMVGVVRPRSGGRVPLWFGILATWRFPFARYV